MKKKTITVLIFVFVILAMGALLFYNIWNNYSNILKANWGISLPYKAVCKEVYSNTDSGWPGDGLRYHVFSYKYEDYIDNMFVWLITEKETIYKDSYSKAAKEWLDKLNVPEENRPDFSKTLYYWYHSKDDNDEIILILDEENNLLYILESLI